MPTKPSTTASVSALVPVICVVPEGIADRLDRWANDPASLAVVEPLAEVMERNGWTASMLLAGAALAIGVEASTVGATR